ncbi:MAG TPA: APC family permease [Ktedonobacteraceae bacterium]|nr:APC family permease [Ktedonobacteraceae bacterium]
MATLYDKPAQVQPEIIPDAFGELPSEEYSAKAMPKVAGPLGMIATYVLIIFFITNTPSAIAAGAGTFTFWIVGGLTFFIPCAICTAQLGHMFPHEGSLYNWTHRAFGGYWSFFVAFCAWFPCILLMIVAADGVVGYLQGLNPNWLQAPWQQGLVLILIVAFSGFIATRRFATTLNLVKVVLGIAFLAVFITGLAGVVWLLKGHHAATSFKTPTDWGFAWNPNGYYTLALFAFIVQSFLGIEVPLNMGGEMTGRKIVTRHLFWGTILVLVGYLVTTFGLLVVVGTTPSGNPFAMVLAVKIALGPVAGNILAILIMCNFVVTPAVYSYSYARLLLVGGIDQRLPMRAARLNKNRVPANAIIFQTVVAVGFAVILFIVIPLFGGESNASVLNSEVYNVVISASTLVWAISTAFLPINLVKFFFNDQRAFRKQLIFPMPILWICIFFGTVTCIISIIGALFFSLIPALIPNNVWWLIVGGITAVCIVLGLVGSMLASSEAGWQKLHE